MRGRYANENLTFESDDYIRLLQSTVEIKNFEKKNVFGVKIEIGMMAHFQRPFQPRIIYLQCSLLIFYGYVAIFAMIVEILYCKCWLKYFISQFHTK